MNGITFLTGNSQEIYNRVFKPLAEGCQTIEESKKYYNATPYAKLRTTSEDSAEQVALYCNVIQNNSYLSTPLKFFTGARNAIGNTVNSFLPDTTWNCTRLHAAQALDTAIDVFSDRISGLESRDDLVGLEALQKEVKQIHSTLTASLSTIFYVYKTYHEISDTENEKAEIEKHEKMTQNVIGPLTLRPQYQNLQNLVDRVGDLLKRLEPKESSVDEGEGKDAAPEKSEEPEAPVEDYVIAVRAMADKGLVFKTEEAASKWFLNQLNNSRALNETNGSNAHADLMKLVRSAEQVPQAFTDFAETLDKAFKDPLAHYTSLEDVCTKMKPLLEKKGLQPTKQPENFQVLLSHLYKAKAGREVYQALFRVLINEEGTAPRGIVYQPALLNAIMNSHYFPMFDPESI